MIRLILFVNDSYFSFLLAKPLIDYYHEHIGLLVLSTRVQRSPAAVIRIFRKSSLKYFCYRSTIQALSLFNSLLGRKTVKALARQYNIELIKTRDIKKDRGRIAGVGSFHLGVALNFDQIIGQGILDLVEEGVINVHASRLPEDRGISPVLWAFARGDKEIWSSIYKLDAGIDTGPIIEQFKIAVDNHATAFSLYRKVCIESGERLVAVIRKVEGGPLVLRPQVRTGNERYWSWPDKYHTELLNRNKRRLMRLSDAVTIVR